MIEKEIPKKTKEKILELLNTAEYSLLEVRDILKKLVEKKNTKKDKKKNFKLKRI